MFAELLAERARAWGFSSTFPRDNFLRQPPTLSRRARLPLVVVATTVETVYMVDVCPRGNLPYFRPYPIRNTV